MESLTRPRKRKLDQRISGRGSLTLTKMTACPMASKASGENCGKVIIEDITAAGVLKVVGLEATTAMIGAVVGSPTGDTV